MKSPEFGDDCIALGFYGLAVDLDRVKSFYSDVIEWFNAVGCPPDKLSIRGPGFSGKPVDFGRNNSRLSKYGFSEVKSFSVFAMRPDGKIPALEWQATAWLDIGVGMRPYFALAARASVASLEDDPLTQLITRCVAALKPAYGIGFHRNFDQGPAFYAAGVNYGATKSYEEALIISRWGDLGMVEEVYNQGRIRGVYEHNYLSNLQLDAKVGRKTLKSWISSDSTRGTLLALDDRMMLWKVPGSRIAHIQKELWSAEAIFNWKSYLTD